MPEVTQHLKPTPGFDTLVRMNKGLVATNREGRGERVMLKRAISIAVDSARPVVESGSEVPVGYTISRTAFVALRDIIERDGATNG